MALRIQKEEEPDESEVPEVEDESVLVEAEVVEDEVIEAEISSTDSETRVGSVELLNYLPRVPQEVREGYRDFTEKEWAVVLEDYNRGFAPLSQEDWEKYQIPDEPFTYRTREKLSANCLKVSAGLVGKWVQANTNKHRQMYPDGYLQDEYGFTPQAVAVFRNMMRYTCKRRFKANADGVIEWSKLDRDTSPIKDPAFSEENPDYVLCSLYWQKSEEMWLDYLELMEWIEEYRKRLTLTQQAYPSSETVQWGDSAARSEFRAREELAKHQIMQHWNQQLNQLKEQMIEVARDKALEAVAEGYEAVSEVFKGAESDVQPDEDDLWTEGD